MKKFLVLFFISLGTLFFTLSNSAIAETELIKNKPISTLSDLFGQLTLSASNQLLEPDEAFRLFAEVNNEQQIVLSWRIAEGYYLYQDKIKVTVIQPKELQLNNIKLPKGQPKVDEIFGDTTVYYDDLIVLPWY